MTLKLFTRAVLALALYGCDLGVPIPAQAVPASAPDLESSNLRLPYGGLIEGIRFRFVWLKEHPEEDAIVLTDTLQRGGATFAAGTAIYTKSGKVFAHSDEFGTVPLRLAPEDLCAGTDKIRSALSAATAELAPQPPAPVGAGTALPHALAALGDRAVCGPFPVAISKLRGSDWLVFDWNGAHFAYRPDVGVLRMTPSVNPLTGTPPVCIKRDDLPDAVFFCREYLRAHPEEKARVLFLPRAIGDHTGGWCGAAYTRNGALYFHGVFTGEQPASPLTAADIDDTTLLEAWRHLLDRSVARVWAQAHPGMPLPRALDPFAALPATIPTSLPGDTDELQIDRAYQRAQALGLSSDVSRWPPTREPALVLCWGPCRFAQVPSFTGLYNGPTDATIRPNRLIDGILFAQRYGRENPGERALAIPYRESGSTKTKAVVAYVRDGRVWIHNPEAGENRLSDFRPDDLDNPAKFKALRLAGNQLLKTAALRQDRRRDALLAGLDLWNQPDTSALEVPAVRRALKAAGLPCRLLPDTRERAPDGTIADYPLPSLTFKFWGVVYTYGPEHYCTASDGFVLLP